LVAASSHGALHCFPSYRISPGLWTKFLRALLSNVNTITPISLWNNTLDSLFKVKVRTVQNFSITFPLKYKFSLIMRGHRGWGEVYSKAMEPRLKHSLSLFQLPLIIV